MKHFVFTCEYAYEAVLCCEEYGCAKHAHIGVSKVQVA